MHPFSDDVIARVIAEDRRRAADAARRVRVPRDRRLRRHLGRALVVTGQRLQRHVDEPVARPVAPTC